MAQWLRTLNLVDVWQLASEREITPQHLSKVVAERLSALKKFGDEAIDWQTENLVEEFQSFAEEDVDSVSFDDFDYILQGLYDWADSSFDGEWNGMKVCWVKTF